MNTLLTETFPELANDETAATLTSQDFDQRIIKSLFNPIWAAQNQNYSISDPEPNSELVRAALELACYLNRNPDSCLLATFFFHRNADFADIFNESPEILDRFCRYYDACHPNFFYEDCVMIWSAFSANSARSMLANCFIFNCHEGGTIESEMMNLLAAKILTDADVAELLEETAIIEVTA